MQITDLWSFPKHQHANRQRYELDSGWTSGEEAEARVQVLKGEGWLAFAHRFQPDEVGVYKRRSMREVKYGPHGRKFGICYRKKTGAKIYASKEEGVVIVQDSAGFYWRLSRDRMYDDERIVSIRKGGKWVDIDE